MFGRIYNWLLDLIKLRFCRKYTAMEIFLDAADNTDVHTPYMCYALSVAAKRKLRVRLDNIRSIARWFARYGFDRENYHEFVKKNYPELQNDLERFLPIWILGSSRETVLETKREFFKYLANRLQEA